MERLKPQKKGGGLYFTKPSPDIDFIPSGSVLLDCVIGGGWPLGRMVNIVGDKSTGKTLLAIEAAANFAEQYPKGEIWYREAESAFDKGYAGALGMPLDRINPGEKNWSQFDTVEQVFEDLSEKLEWCKHKGRPALYILDSLDSLSDKEEMGRKMGEGSFNLGKQKKLGELFRRKVREIEESQLCFMIISQVRDKIGVSFGDKTTRTGGRAMDFYASQIVKLALTQTIYETKKGIKRATGLRIRAKCTKNKVGLALRECEFVLTFGFGIDDYQACMEWLVEVKRWGDLGLTKEQAVAKAEESMAWDNARYLAEKNRLNDAVTKAWAEIETDFLPKRRKYG